MKLTGNESAFARPMSVTGTGEDYYESNAQTGLTIRQHFAAMAMQGLLSNGFQNSSDFKGLDERSNVAAYSIQFADALIAELNKNEAL